MSDFRVFIPFRDAAKPNPLSVFQFDGIRFTLLTQRMLRIEISSSNQFEDSPSQIFWYRNQPLPEVSIEYTENNLHIETDFFSLSYQKSLKIFQKKNPLFTIKHSGQTIHLDSPNPSVFPGTARTLDKTNGSIEIQPGILARSGWCFINDTNSLVFDREGWLNPRSAQKGYRDLYLLVSGKDYKSALRDYQLISGRPPLLPRAFLGNWWSRYWEYSQEEIKQLVKRFSEEKIPLSVFIIDMDWHITKTGNNCTGWTGFSWNRDLFPNPEKLIQWLHDHNLMISLNLHPAEGIHPHEDQYPSAAEKMGIDPEKQAPISFDSADPKFTRVYFEQVLHPLENQGVDFWWIDWQQGTKSTMRNLDPLWWLNHLHFYDLGRSEAKRPIIFSRWGGGGNHRYPIGFSGDTISSWESLSYQPFFTSTAANIAYGWWSHDIGGHMDGVEDGELYTRWVQFGVLSPIFRLHCTKNEFVDRSPWAFGQEILRITKQAMQFRHALVPYLYTMAQLNEETGMPLITPLYYDWPNEKSAYAMKNQYMFGTSMMAAPITAPLDPDLNLARKVIWMPPGIWFNFFTGEQKFGPQMVTEYFALDEIPLFVKAGAILPLQGDVTGNGCSNPENIELMVFPGNGSFEMYEDDGATQKYQNDGGVITRYTCDLNGSTIRLHIDPPKGDLQWIPMERTYCIKFRGVEPSMKIVVLKNGNPLMLPSAYTQSDRTLSLGPVVLLIEDNLTVEITTIEKPCNADQYVDLAIYKIINKAAVNTNTKWKIWHNLELLKRDSSLLKSFGLTKNQHQALKEVLTKK